MNIIPFRTQYDKIVSAYIKNELNPYDSCACFIGNLLDNDILWSIGRIIKDCEKKITSVKISLDNVCYLYESIQDNANSMYTPEEICRMEQNFLRTYNNGKNEESLYKAMESTLLILKEIHERLGDVVEPYNFTKRQLERQSI